MKNLLALLTLLTLAGIPAGAEQAATAISKTGTPRRIPRAMPAPVVEMIFTGKVTRIENSTGGKPHSHYLLLTATGQKIALPARGAPGGNFASFDEYLNKDVVLSAKGAELVTAEKTFISIREVQSVRILVAPTPVPPAVGTNTVQTPPVPASPPATAATNVPAPVVQTPVPQRPDVKEIEPPKVDATNAAAAASNP